MGDKTEAGLRNDKANALQAVNEFLPQAMRFAKALEDWEEWASGSSGGLF